MSLLCYNIDEVLIMNEEIKLYLKNYPSKIVDLFERLRQIIFESVNVSIEEKMWAKLPTYYAGELFVRLIPIKDHINIEASAIINYKSELYNYKITPKGMLQLFIDQEIPSDLLINIF